MTVSQMIYENALDLYNAGLLDNEKMQEFEKNHQPIKRSVPSLSPQDIAVFSHIERKAKTINLDELISLLKL